MTYRILVFTLDKGFKYIDFDESDEYIYDNIWEIKNQIYMEFLR